MIRLSEVAEEGVKLPFHPVVFGIGMFSLLALALYHLVYSFRQLMLEGESWLLKISIAKQEMKKKLG